MGRRFYILWLVAASLSAIGAAADIAWHFSRLFDEFSPPHNIATTGFIVNLGLLFWALVLRRQQLSGPEHTGLLLSAGAIAAYLIGIPLDLAWHVIFGVDITAWSPTHLLLFYSSWVGQIAMMLAWLASPTARRRGAWAVTFAIGVLQLSSGLFPLGQQEYGAVALDALARTGRAPWYVAPDMWALAGRQAERLARGGAPDWLYLVALSTMGGLCLALGASLIRSHDRRTRPRSTHAATRWYAAGAATGLVAALLLFRLVMRAIFAAVHMPVAVIPWWLLALGLAIDASLFLAPRLAFISPPRWAPFPLWATAQTRQTTVVAALGGMLGSLAIYGIIATMRAAHAIVPATQLASLPFAMLAGAIGSAAGVLLAARMIQFAEATLAPAASVLPVLVASTLRGWIAPLSQGHWRSWVIAVLRGRKTITTPSPRATSE